MTMMSSAVRLSSLLLLLGASACTATPQSALWSDADARRQIVVHHIELHHDVAFARGSAELAPSEARRLDDFIERQHVGYGDAVEIAVPGEATRLDARRAASVSERLARAGIGAERAVVPSSSGVRVIVGRNVAVPPACPDWRKADNDGDPSNTPMSNLGCANMRNLGLMIADPGELIAGRSAGAGSGEPLAAGVERYRTGKVTPLNDSGMQATQ
jgi:pilus assembly protein CpaD